MSPHAKRRRHRSVDTCWGLLLVCAAGEEVVEYMGPRPPVGIHRYVLVLFEQKTRVHAEGPGERANFNTRAFAAAHELGLPTAVVYFNAQKEPANHRRR
jgi:phosphatidylethanolamine-binding protein